MDERETTWAEEQALRWRALALELHRRLGAGVPLDALTRGRIERRLGADFAGVVVHRHPLASRLVHAFGAHALSAGQHLLGDERQLDPSTPRGLALLGHELVHVAHFAGKPSGAILRTPAREPADEEEAAQAVEQTLLDRLASASSAPSESRARTASPVDVEALADRVYVRMVRDLTDERDRCAGWSA